MMAIQESAEDISEELEDDAKLEVVSWAVDEFVEDEIIEKEGLVELRTQISLPQAGGVEMILNLREWLKSPWQLFSDD